MAKYTSWYFTPAALFWGLAAVALAYLVHFIFLWARGHHRPHFKALFHFHYHLIFGLIVALFIGVFVGVTVYEGLGLKFQKDRHIRPDAHLVKLGDSAPYSYSLAKYLPPVVLDQGQTNACAAFAVTEARYMADVIRGGSPPDVFSGFYTYWWVTGGASVPTSIDSEAQSVHDHGTTLWGNQPYFGAPSQVAINTAVEQGGSFHYLFYNFGGQSSVDAVKAEISTGHPVILLMIVNSDFQNAFGGVGYTNNGGYFISYHAVIAYAYDGNNIYVRNTWGARYGNNGNIMLTSTAVFNTVFGAVVIDPSPASAYMPKAKPKPKPKPKVQHLLVTRNTLFRRKPLLSTRTRYLVHKGSRLIYLGKHTPNWLYAETLNKKHRGWVFKPNTRKVK